MSIQVRRDTDVKGYEKSLSLCSQGKKPPMHFANRNVSIPINQNARRWVIFDGHTFEEKKSIFLLTFSIFIDILQAGYARKWYSNIKHHSSAWDSRCQPRCLGYLSCICSKRHFIVMLLWPLRPCANRSRIFITNSIHEPWIWDWELELVTTVHQRTEFSYRRH